MIHMESCDTHRTSMPSSAGIGKVSCTVISDITSGSILAHAIISEGVTSECIAMERPKTRQGDA